MDAGVRGEGNYARRSSGGLRSKLDASCIKLKMHRCVRGLGLVAAFALELALLRGVSAHADATPIPHGTLELIAEDQWIAAGRSFNLGLHFQLEKGWHIYWVNPGDSGEPPRVDWRLPMGVKAGAIEWPTPQRFQSSTIADYGYEDAVLLMVPVSVDARLQPQPSAEIEAEVKLLVCSHEMCIPGKAGLSLTLPMRRAQPAPETRNAGLFSVTRKSLPLPPPRTWRLSVAQTGDSFVLTANLGRLTASREITGAIFFPLVESQIENAAPQKLLSLATGFRLTLRKSDRLLKSPERLKGVLVVSSGSSQPDRAYSIDVAIKNPVPHKNPARTTGSSSALGIRQRDNRCQYNP